MKHVYLPNCKMQVNFYFNYQYLKVCRGNDDEAVQIWKGRRP